MDKIYMVNDYGIHLVAPGASVSICGKGIVDGCYVEQGHPNIMHKTSRKLVTCKYCIDLVHVCVGVKVKRRRKDIL